MELYEALRCAVLCARMHVEGIGAIVFHGLWRGLVVLSTTPCATPVPGVRPAPAPTTSHDRQLVRLLANMVLAAESQVRHAY